MLDYKMAGVDIHAGNELVKRIKPLANKTKIPGVLGGLGGFGSLFELGNYKNPVLVSGTDGVGTKLKLAQELNIHDTIGIDLVAMCVNDIIVQGAKPLFFLDYFSTGKLNIDVAESVIEGIAKGCELAGVALVGGETAEMPGMYQDGEYDLAGFCVGVVEKDKIIPNKVKPNDILIGISSSGVHSNGFSLIRKIIKDTNSSLTDKIGEKTLGEILLEPTKIYVKSILTLLENVDVHAIAHITGGGITENLPRVLPDGVNAKINMFDFPDIFNWIQHYGEISTSNMLTTFNCGIGMIICVDPSGEEKTLDILKNLGENAFVIGSIFDGNGTPKTHYFN